MINNLSQLENQIYITRPRKNKQIKIHLRNKMTSCTFSNSADRSLFRGGDDTSTKVQGKTHCKNYAEYGGATRFFGPVGAF